MTNPKPGTGKNGGPTTAPRPVSRNLIRLFDAAPADVVRAGLEWYPQANKACSKLRGRGMTLEQSAAIVAVLSQQLSWPRTLAAAEQVIRNGKRLPGVLEQSYRKAAAIRAGADPADIVTGNKVRSFWRNLLLDYDYLTIDRHAIGAAIGRNPTQSEAKQLESAKRYALYQSAYLKAARSRGLPGPEFQAAVWLFWKQIKQRGPGMPPRVLDHFKDCRRPGAKGSQKK